MKDKIPSWLRRVWEKTPFRQMTLLVLALFIIKERFPFSNFPMYSNISEEADVAFVTDQNDKPVAMKDVFKTGSATAKKMYRKELSVLTQPKGRDSEHATPDERKLAGKAVLDSMMPRLIKKAVPADATAMRFHLRTFRAGGGKITDMPSELLAEQSL